MIVDTTSPRVICDNPCGLISPPGSMVVRKTFANRRIQGLHFQLATHPTQHTPIIRCQETGNFWRINWEQLIEIAMEDGIHADPIEATEGDEA